MKLTKGLVRATRFSKILLSQEIIELAKNLIKLELRVSIFLNVLLVQIV